MGSFAPPLTTNVVSYGANVTLAENGVRITSRIGVIPSAYNARDRQRKQLIDGDGRILLL